MALAGPRERTLACLGGTSLVPDASSDASRPRRAREGGHDGDGAGAIHHSPGSNPGAFRAPRGDQFSPNRGAFGAPRLGLDVAGRTLEPFAVARGGYGAGLGVLALQYLIRG